MFFYILFILGKTNSKFYLSPELDIYQTSTKLYSRICFWNFFHANYLLDKWLKELENRGGGVTSGLNNAADFLTTSPTPLALSLRRSCSAKRSSGGAAGVGYKSRKQRANSHVAVATKIDDAQLALLSNQRIHRAHSHQAGPQELLQTWTFGKKNQICDL